MKSLFYSWMVFQMVAGFWVFISPFVLGYRDTILAGSNMIFGAIVVILGAGTTFFEFYHPLLSSTAALIASEL
jgi:hypothetical protein